jgi:3-methyladenine DNA glycosylase AlkD
MTPAEYVNAARSLYSANANALQAEPMKAYMKHHFAFLGIPKPQAKQLQRIFFQQYGLLPLEQLEPAVGELWRQPEREYQYLALTLIDKSLKRLGPEAIDWLEELVVTKSWWDTVDYLAAHPIGFLLRRHRDLCKERTAAWLRSDNMWLSRTAILFQLYYKTDTDVPQLFDAIHACADSREFFLRKAIGWALREYSKTDPQTVMEFVESVKLSPLSVREALKIVRKPD